MNNKSPVLIFTNQDFAMSKAIENVTRKLIFQFELCYITVGIIYYNTFGIILHYNWYYIILHLVLLYLVIYNNTVGDI